MGGGAATAAGDGGGGEAAPAHRGRRRGTGDGDGGVASWTAPTNLPCGAPNSGHVSPTMNTRMPSTQTTIPIPPMVMTTAAARSVRLTPARRLVDASTFSRTVSGGLVKLAQLLRDDGGGQGQIAVLHHDLLALAAEHELQELLDQRVEGLARAPC